MGDVLDVPLKKSTETFVDEPLEIGDVNVHDLVIDINNDSKDINKLYLCEAISILLYTLEDLMKLQDRPELFDQFRSDFLDRNGVDATIRSCSPSPPPSKITKTMPSDEAVLKETTPESLGSPNDQHDHNHNIENNENSNNNSAESAGDDVYDSDSDTSSEYVPPVVISIESLLSSTDLEKSYAIDFQDIKSEIAFYQNPKVLAQSSHVTKVFDLVSPPNLTIETFLTRIKTYSSAISVSCYIHAAFLVFKLSLIHNVLKLTPCNVYRLILASLRCSTKKLEDIYQKQKTFATVGGVTTKDLFKIEVGFLFLCNFRLIVSEDTLNTYLKSFTNLRSFVKERIDDSGK